MQLSKKELEAQLDECEKNIGNLAPAVESLFEQQEFDYEISLAQEEEAVRKLENSHGSWEADLMDNYDSLMNTKNKLKLELEELDRLEQIKTIIKDNFLEVNHILEDIPKEKDYLNRASIARELTHLIMKRDTLSPLTVGIYGAWGDGKSSFLKLINNEIKQINSQKSKLYDKGYIVEFNASEYDNEEKIWYSLCNQLFKVYLENSWLSKLLGRELYTLNFIVEKIRNNWMHYLVLIVYSFIPIIIMKLNTNFIDLYFPNVANKLVWIYSVVQALLLVVKPTIEIYLSFNDKKKKDLFRDAIFPNYKKNLGTREVLKEQLSVLIKSWNMNKNFKVVILVDELDRCSQTTISEFFSAIELFLPISKIVYIMGINKDTVCTALAEKNRYQLEEDTNKETKKEFGLQMLEKYINIPITLPHIKDYSRYIENEFIGGDWISNDEKLSITIAVNAVASVRKINPREVKKILNLLLISKERINSLRKEKYTIKFSEFIPWFIFCYFFRADSVKLIDNLGVHSNYIYDNVIKNFQLTQNGESVAKLMNLKSIPIKYLIQANKISEVIIVNDEN